MTMGAALAQSNNTDNEQCR